MLGSNWKNLVKKLAKNDLKKLIITHPQTLKDLLALYKKTSALEVADDVKHVLQQHYPQYMTRR